MIVSYDNVTRAIVGTAETVNVEGLKTVLTQRGVPHLEWQGALPDTIERLWVTPGGGLALRRAHQRADRDALRREPGRRGAHLEVQLLVDGVHLRAVEADRAHPVLHLQGHELGLSHGRHPSERGGR